MKRFLVLVAILTPLVAYGCSDPQVVTEAAITDQSTGERLALGDLPIRLLPYDRDAVFDSLEAAYDVPEPPIPAAVLEQKQAVQEAQMRWRAAEEQWATVRDSLRVLSDNLTDMQERGLRGTPQYAQAFEQFGSLESQEENLNQRMESAFSEFDALQQESLAAGDSIRTQRDLWAEEAFRDFNTVIAQKLEESGEEALADTTSAEGIATFRAPAGNWWVYGRYTLPYEELYWNIPVEVTGDSVHIILSRDNAEVRPVL